MAKPANKGEDCADEKENVIQIEKVNEKVLSSLTDELQKLYKHKAKYVINDDGSCTFYPTPNCKQSNKTLKTEPFNMNNAMKKLNCNKMESCSNNANSRIIPSNTISSFITSAITAWSDHYPLRIKPEHIWLTILQTVAIHVDQNAEKLRSKYVKFEGKKELVIYRDDFVMGSAKNDWEGVIKEFVEQIDKNTVQDTVQLFECDFTKSSLIEQIATKVTIMDICKNYFEYTIETLCGFPQITLDGTKKDWILLKKKTQYLLKNKVDPKFGAWWSDMLLPILDRFIVAFDGNIDCLFWNSMIKEGATIGSGPSKPTMSGWFNILYPMDNHCNAYSIQNRCFGGMETDKYPTGLSSAPVLWKYYDSDYALKFIAGFAGFTQNEKTLEICPNVDWCIAHCGKGVFGFL